MSITIRQIESPRPGEPPRTLRLDGSLAPVDRLSFGGEQRAEIECLPGSSVASVRLDGPSEGSTDITFRWRGRRFTLFGNEQLTTLDAVVDALEAIRRDTALVEVVWRGRTHTGVLAEVNVEEGLAAELDVTVTFPGQRVCRGEREVRGHQEGVVVAGLAACEPWRARALSRKRGP